MLIGKIAFLLIFTFKTETFILDKSFKNYQLFKNADKAYISNCIRLFILISSIYFRYLNFYAEGISN